MHCRYKIYVEGNAWSVSQKYILACDSLALLLEPQYFDFFTRGLNPMQHYWPIRNGNNDCHSIKYAVDWGNTHQQQAFSHTLLLITIHDYNHDIYQLHEHYSLYFCKHHFPYIKAPLNGHGPLNFFFMNTSFFWNWCGLIRLN